MSNEIKPEGHSSVDPRAADPSANPAASTESGASAQQADMAAQLVLDKLMAENADLKDKLLRAHAEMDNIRKRGEREKGEAHKYAVTKFARDIVTVGDNFQRAIETVPAGAAEQSAALKSFLEGVTMTERELLNTLERHGIQRIDPKGQPFNPHHHQAVSEVQNVEVPSGTVTQVFQAGYLIEDRVLRPAMVVVAKGGAKAVKAVDNSNGNGAQPQASGEATGQATAHTTAQTNDASADGSNQAG